jgi:hypothetical protein
LGAVIQCRGARRRQAVVSNEPHAAVPRQTEGLVQRRHVE